MIRFRMQSFQSRRRIASQQLQPGDNFLRRRLWAMVRTPARHVLQFEEEMFGHRDFAREAFPPHRRATEDPSRETIHPIAPEDFDHAVDQHTQ